MCMVHVDVIRNLPYEVAQFFDVFHSAVLICSEDKSINNVQPQRSQRTQRKLNRCMDVNMRKRNLTAGGLTKFFVFAISAFSAVNIRRSPAHKAVDQSN